MTIDSRKNNHIDICLNKDIKSKLSNGFEHYRLIHNAMPESDFNKQSIETNFLNKIISAPFIISSMTGGTEYGEEINRKLIESASFLNIPFAIGSQRIYLENKKAKVLPIRKIAPVIPILANIGAVQLNYGYHPDDLKQLVDMIEADALILHVNPLQELIQKEGNTDFSDLLRKVELLCKNFPVPIIVKEVGWGINADLAKKLYDVGVKIIDVAGAGGASWSKVESQIYNDLNLRRLAEPFDDWGIPTADCVAMIHEKHPGIEIIASGGFMNGVEAAKAVFLGAKLIGFASRILPYAVKYDTKKICEEIKLIINQFKIAMFLSAGIERVGKE